MRPIDLPRTPILACRAVETPKGLAHLRFFWGGPPSIRHDFGVSWQDNLPGGGVVVSNKVAVALDVEAIPLEDLERTGAIANYRVSPRGVTIPVK